MSGRFVDSLATLQIVANDRFPPLASLETNDTIGPKLPLAWQSAQRISFLGVDIGKPHLIEVGTTEQLKSVFVVGTRELSSTLPF